MSHIDSSFLTIAQIFLDIVLLILFFLVYRRIRTLNPKRIDELLTALKETEDLGKRLDHILKEKKELVKHIEGAISKAGSIKTASSSNLNTEIQGEELNRTRVITLWKQGKTPEEIAKATGLSSGEIEIIISLARTRQNMSKK